MPEFAILIINTAAALFMTGVIWFVQIVHYPLFIFADKESFPQFSITHSNKAGYVVILPMLAELLTALLLIYLYPSSPFYKYYVFAFLLLAVVWVSTFLIQVPVHKKLSGGYNKNKIEILVKYNWIRTIGWSLRTILLIYLVLQLNEK